MVYGVKNIEPAIKNNFSGCSLIFSESVYLSVYLKKEKSFQYFRKPCFC